MDADLSGYFDVDSPRRIAAQVARRVSDGSILRLVKLFLKAPIVEEKEGKRRISQTARAGRRKAACSRRLLANLYLNSWTTG